MTAATDAQASPATTVAVAGAEEWSEAFGDLDLDHDTDTQHSTTTTAAADQRSTPSATASDTDKLNIIEPLWFLRTDELSATEAYAHDTKSRIREILSFRIDRSNSTSSAHGQRSLRSW